MRALSNRYIVYIHRIFMHVMYIMHVQTHVTSPKALHYPVIPWSISDPLEELQRCEAGKTMLLHFLSNLMGCDRGDSFPFHFEPN